jgi:hypothetical protein
MIAAIYARKSTEQNGVGDEEKSVTRQIEHAKAYATTKGWAAADDYVYVVMESRAPSSRSGRDFFASSTRSSQSLPSRSSSCPRNRAWAASRSRRRTP